MDPVTAQIILAVIANAPEYIALAQQTISMFQNNRLTADDLSTIWQQIGHNAKAAEARWKAANTPAAA